jgi:hypothetical protein
MGVLQYAKDKGMFIFMFLKASMAPDLNLFEGSPWTRELSIIHVLDAISHLYASNITQ